MITDYVWIDGFGGLRSKSRVGGDPMSPWNYDGSSTGQALVGNSEITLKPVAKFKDPFRRPEDVIVLCDSAERREALKVFDKWGSEEKPWYGIEQEFFIGTPEIRQERNQHHYCGVGILHRSMMEKFYTNCMLAGINIAGINAEVSPGQWEYQVGPVEGIAASDQLWISRYILFRTAEDENLTIYLEPKPYGASDEWNYSGCHVNFSTEIMRSELNGLKAIMQAVKKVGEKHSEDIKHYGSGNEERLSGEKETSHYKKFTSGCGDRTASVRIPSHVVKNGYGYFEDRRPSSDMNPYEVTSRLLKNISH